MPRVVTARAILLRSVDYRDTDRILTFYTREQGRVSCIARGARSSRRRFAGALEAFCVIDAELSFGRSDLATLKSATVVQMFPALLKRLDRLQRAGAAVELVRNLTVDAAEEPRLFDALSELFGLLADAPEDEAAALLAFQARALALCGFSPGLDVCVVTGNRRPVGQAAYFDATRGGIISRAALGGSSRGQLLVGGAALARLTQSLGAEWVPEGAWAAEERAQVEAVLGAFIAQHVR